MDNKWKGVFKSSLVMLRKISYRLFALPTYNVIHTHTDIHTHIYRNMLLVIDWCFLLWFVNFYLKHLIKHLNQIFGPLFFLNREKKKMWNGDTETLNNDLLVIFSFHVGRWVWMPRVVIFRFLFCFYPFCFAVLSRATRFYIVFT